MVFSLNFKLHPKILQKISPEIIPRFTPAILSGDYFPEFVHPFLLGFLPECLQGFDPGFLLGLLSEFFPEEKSLRDCTRDTSYDSFKDFSRD